MKPVTFLRLCRLSGCHPDFIFVHFIHYRIQLSWLVCLQDCNDIGDCDDGNGDDDDDDDDDETDGDNVFGNVDGDENDCDFHHHYYNDGDDIVGSGDGDEEWG